MKTNSTLCLAALILIAAFISACGPGSPAASVGLNIREHGEATLDNDLKLLIHPRPADANPLVGITVWVGAGVDAEGPEEAGYSSVLARLLGSDKDAAAVFDGMGTTLGVDLQPDGLQLSTMVLSADAGTTVETILEQLSGGFEADRIAAVRDSLVNDLEAIRATSGARARDLLSVTLYRGSARGVSLDERVAELRALTPERFQGFVDRAVRPDAALVTLVGALDQTLLDRTVELGREWNATPLPDEQPETAGATAEGEEAEAEDEAGEEESYTPVRILPREGGPANFFLLRRLPGLVPADYYALQAVNVILNGETTYGRLNALQVNLRLGSAIVSSLDLRNTESGHIITASAPAERAGEVFSGIMQQLQVLHSGQVLNSRLLEQEVSDARNYLRGQLLRATETPLELARFMAWSDRHGFAGSLPEDHLALIAGIDRQQLLRVVEEYYIPLVNALVAVGPSAELERGLSEFGPVEVVH